MAFITFQPSDHFNTKLYTGNGSTQSITGVGFQPDWLWVKRRDSADHHCLEDVIRGAGYSVRTSGSDAQQYRNNDITSFDSDGFSLGSSGETNINSGTFVSWNWKAGGAGSANTDGSTSSTVSANTTAGFSIVKYTNPSSGSPFTVGHGLGAVPKMIITKRLDATQTWGIYHIGPGFGKYLRFDSTADEASANLVTATSTTTFSSYYDHHDAGAEIIAYCFAEIKGFSKIGKYRANGTPGDRSKTDHEHKPISPSPFPFGAVGIFPFFFLLRGRERAIIIFVTVANPGVRKVRNVVICK